MIDILVPVLGRPQNAQPLVDSIKAATKTPHRILFLCSQGDRRQIEACMKTGQETIVCSFPADRSDYPKKMNIGFKETKGAFLLLGADDLDFELGWDKIVLNAAKKTGASVIGTNDMANAHVRRGKTSTHPVVRRSYVRNKGGSCDGPGVLIHEGYDHNFSERELNHLAQSRSEWTFCPNARIRHRHPLWKTAQMDPTYRKGLQSFKEDQKLFFSRAHLWGYAGMSSAETTYSKRHRG